MSGSLPAVLCAVAAATLLGASTVAQRRGMCAPTAGPGGLLAALVRSRWWWAGTLGTVAGLGLQFLALAAGSLILVQTTMVASIVVTTLAESLLLRRRPGARRWTGMVMTTLGLSTVLLAVSPTAAAVAVTPSGTSMLVLAGITLTVSAGAALWARATTASAGLALSVATGLGYGVSAVALKTVGAELGSGWAAPLGHPALWTAVVVGPLSVLLSQHALRRARAVAAAVSVIVVIDPLVGLLAGIAWFGEHVVATPLSLTAALAAAAGVIAGIVLAHSESRSSRPGEDRGARPRSAAQPERLTASTGGPTRT